MDLSSALFLRQEDEAGEPQRQYEHQPGRLDEVRKAESREAAQEVHGFPGKFRPCGAEMVDQLTQAEYEEENPGQDQGVDDLSGRVHQHTSSILKAL